jgi:hypothetical protein
MTDDDLSTPLTEVEKAELLNAFPLTPKGRLWLRRVYAEIDRLKAQRGAAEAGTLKTIEPEILAMAHDWPVMQSDGGDTFTGDLLIHRLADEIDAQLATKAEAGTWEPALRELRDAIVYVWGDVENCEDCGDKAEAGNDVPCAVHESTRLYQAIRAADEVLGPCVCGHPSSRHHDEDTTHCKVCQCEAFQLPKLPAPPASGTET